MDDHLSRLEEEVMMRLADGVEINDSFPDEHVSKWVEAIALSNNEGKSVTGFLEKVFSLDLSSGQVEVSNREIKQILAKNVNANIFGWSRRLDDALCAYHTAFKTPIELEHKAMWGLKKLDLDWDTASSQRLNEIIELDEFHLKAYESLALWRLFPGKLKSKWTGPYKVVEVFSHGAVELENDERTRFNVNGQRIKIYLGKTEEFKELIEEWDLDEV
ncbi:uncharacterized protein LOC125863710 [Solanum stenotomum]|uniref:uncharacterized protein LOC125863710 n=1 Tax=Solanum stenotomum TaxID=172797 RepID=UPI0020D03C16|nr:uncharacterized protein LOC125863710 [Solanum stenotomum]